MMSQPPPRKRAEILQCPHCDNEVGVTLDLAARQIPCPHCDGAMIIPSVDGSTDLPTHDNSFVLEYETPEDDEARYQRLLRESESRLNSLRIQTIAAERRDLNRRRSFSMAVAVALGIVVVHCLLVISRNVIAGGGWGTGSTALGAIAILSAYVATRLFRRSRQLTAETRRPLLDDPGVEPDFTPLSDGSQRWRNLEEIQ